MDISLCIATYRRPDRLGLLLDDIVRQECLPDELIVVDNDASGSARAVIERRRELGAPFPIRYEIQPVKNIALTRNRTASAMTGTVEVIGPPPRRAPLPRARGARQGPSPVSPADP